MVNYELAVYMKDERRETFVVSPVVAALIIAASMEAIFANPSWVAICMTWPMNAHNASHLGRMRFGMYCTSLAIGTGYNKGIVSASAKSNSRPAHPSGAFLNPMYVW